MNIAIIGTRNPDDMQIAEVKRFIRSLPIINTIIVSGCAYGIDELALYEARIKGIKTKGCIPWADYNTDVQKYCDKIILLKDNDKEAYDSVIKYHPVGNKLSQGALKLHARNYLIISGCDLVIAFPGDTGGGTLQGIKLAEIFGIECIINPHIEII